MRPGRLSLAIVVLAGAGCGGSGKALLGNGGTGGGGTGGGGAGGGAAAGGNRLTGTISESVNRNVDILFMIDDSSSMRLQQNNLINNFPTFMTALQNSPQGLPNLHIAVISQDMGAGDGSIAGCENDSNGTVPAGNRGIFQYTARGNCTTTNLQQGATYISNVAGTANYTGNLADVFGCIAALGESGCGFEHQFASTLRALGADGSPAPAENQGFLRPEAYLVIVMLTNEDDCSALPNSGLYAPGYSVAGSLGVLSNFRCNEFGHLCTMAGGAPAPPTRLAPNNDVNVTFNYDSCTSNDSGGYLLSVKDTANRLKALKADSSMVALTAITGPPTPYMVHWKNPSVADTSCNTTGQSCPWPEITHSCTASDGSFADPGVRTAQLVGEFGINGLALSICDASLAPSLMRVGQLINGMLAPPCISEIISLDPATGQPDCQLTEHTGTVAKAIPSCASNGGTPPCWRLVSGSSTSCSGQLFEISVDPNASSTSTPTITYSCGQCTAGMPDPTRGCP